jgi:phosphatidylglycerol:prolipoprotein diacylglycerol transferase
MRPNLFSLHLGGDDFGLHTYGVLVALGFAAGIALIWREGRRQGFDGGRLLDLCFWGLVTGLAASRLTFVLVNARAFADACWGPGSAAEGRLSGCFAALRFWDGGFVFYGGALAVAALVYRFCRRERWSFLRLGDVCAPALALGHAIGRLGCFAAGCCFGAVCSRPWGASFPPESAAFADLHDAGLLPASSAHTPPLHPTQLYEAFGEAAIFALLLWLRRRGRARDAAPGTLVAAYAIAYSCLRFVVEIFRGDTARGFVTRVPIPRLATLLGLPPDQPIVLSTSQAFSVVVLAATLGAILVARRRHRA